ncbi:MAG: hypothetical protein ACI8W8_002698 [Rhodothermales bacterium]|jgi:hypothetical protein
MTYFTDDIIPACNDPEMTGLSQVPFGDPPGSYFMICWVSAEAIAATGVRDRGPADIYCRYSDQGNECYGGVESCVLHPESFDIRFWPRAQEEIGLESLTINFPAQSPSLPNLGAALNSIFRRIGIFSWRTEKAELRSTVALVVKVLEAGLSRKLGPKERLKVLTDPANNTVGLRRATGGQRRALFLVRPQTGP